MEAHWATVWESIADAIPNEAALVHGATSRTWRELDGRAARLAGAFQAAGVGPGARVAQYLYNSTEYVETYFATLKVGGVPINVNYRYLGDELVYIVEDSDAEVLVYHASLGDRVGAVADRLASLSMLIEVGEVDPTSATHPPVPGALRYEDVVGRGPPQARQTRSPDDTSMTYTGGTTGMPKGVVGMVGPGVRALLTVVPPMIGQPPVGDPAQAAELATRLRDLGTRLVTLPACPLMHGTGMVIGLQTPLVVGGSIVLLEGHRFDPEELWALAQRHRVVLIAIVGDAFARPMLRALDVAADHGRRWDLGALRLISSSGAMFSQEVKEGLLEHLVGVTLLDYISSTEGLMGVSVSTASAIAPTGRFRPVPGVRVFADDGGEITAGSGEPGLVGLSIGVPLGYHKDTVKSARTFREVDGVR